MAQYLVEHHGFTHVSVDPKKQTPTTQEPQAPNGREGTSEPNTHHRRDTTATRALSFASTDALLEHVTQHWRDRWLTTDVVSKATLDAFSRRPFFLLISVDAPLLVRWKRYQERRRAEPDGPDPSAPDADGPSPTALAAFAALSDTQLYHPVHGQATHLSTAPVRLLNTGHSLASLYVNLGKLWLLDPERLRPSWDNYFMSLASLAAQRSNCMKRRVGCVLISATNRVISTGYNGTPRGLRNCNEGGCARCNSGLGSGHGLATCLCIHAEENALLEAGRERLGEGAVLYCDTCPCLTCSIKIAQVGVREVVYSQGYSMDGETAAVFREAGVRLRQFVPVSCLPTSSIIDRCVGVCAWCGWGDICRMEADLHCVACQRSHSPRENGVVYIKLQGTVLIQNQLLASDHRSPTKFSAQSIGCGPRGKGEIVWSCPFDDMQDNTNLNISAVVSRTDF